MLNRSKGIYLLSDRQNDNTSGMLPRTSPNTYTALKYSVYLAGALAYISLFVILFYKAICGFVSKSTYCTCSECLLGTEDNFYIFVSLTLIFTREVKVNIRLLVSLEAKEGLKGYIKAVLNQFLTTDRAYLIGHIDSGSSGIGPYLRRFEIRIMALGAIIVGT